MTAIAKSNCQGARCSIRLGAQLGEQLAVDAVAPGADRALRVLGRYLRQHLYRHYRVLRMTTKARRVVHALFDALLADIELLPTEHQEAARRMESADGKPGRARRRFDSFEQNQRASGVASGAGEGVGDGALSPMMRRATMNCVRTFETFASVNARTSGSSLL